MLHTHVSSGETASSPNWLSLRAYTMPLACSILLFPLICPNVLAAKVFRCTQNDGSVVYSNIACDAEAEPVKFRDSKPRQHPASTREQEPYCRLPDEASLDLANACLDIYRPQLLGSREAYVVSAALAEREDLRRIVLNARTTNRMGAFIELDISCAVTAGNQIDNEATSELIELWSAFQTLNVHARSTRIIDC